jgi:solute carrier family 25 iron transporter 28/37
MTNNERKRRSILAHGVDEIPGDIHFSHTQHMIAGGMAGLIEHGFMFPVDTIKTRMQSAIPTTIVTQSSSSSSVHATTTTTTTKAPGMIQVLKTIRSEGYIRLYSGLSAVLSGAIPSHALYFATYEFAKDCLTNRRIRRSSSDPIPVVTNAPPNTMVIGVAGIMATMAHDAISTPLDVIKQRMQLNGNYRTMLSCFRDVLKNEGMKAFYISYPTTLMMNVPYTMVHFIAYETFKYLLHNDHHHDHDDHDEHDHDDHHHHHGERKEQMWKHFVSGGIAGTLGAAVSNPFDVVKTRLQTQGPKEYAGVRDATRRILKEEGLGGFLRGVTPRMLYHAPSAAITWATYEYMKVLFKNFGT